jgi:hypothetical protein
MKSKLNVRYQCLLAAALVLFIEPALANKFETIGGGLSGSSGFKREWLQKFFLVVGGASLLGAILAVLVPHGNALFLNYNNWKQSAVMFSILAAAMFAAAAFI